MAEMHVTIVVKNKEALRKLEESGQLLRDMKESYPWDTNINELIENFKFLTENLTIEP